MLLRSTSLRSLVVTLSFAVVAPSLLLTACPSPDASSKDDGKKKDGKDKKKKDKDKEVLDDGRIDGDAPDNYKPKPRTPEDERTIRALEGEVAALKRELTGGKSEYAGLINAHEHLYDTKHLEKYLPAARKAGIVATVFVASPKFTLDGKGEKGEPGMSNNFEEILKAEKAFPGEVIPFCTIDPKDSDKLERLKKHVAMGCKGLKIYTGHSNFYDEPLDKPDMLPVYAYLEETGLPVNWHVNLAKFMGDFERVITKYPKLNVMVPHYGVVFWKPSGPAFGRLKELMRKHKNIYVDTSLGTREILLNGMSAMEPAMQEFRSFFTEFQDQIVWGTDSVITGNPEKTPGWYTKVIWATRDQLEKDVFTTELAAAYSKYFQKGRDGEGRYTGLNLSPAILKKIYIDNAKRWLRQQ